MCIHEAHFESFRPVPYFSPAQDSDNIVEGPLKAHHSVLPQRRHAIAHQLKALLNSSAPSEDQPAFLACFWESCRRLLCGKREKCENSSIVSCFILSQRQLKRKSVLFLDSFGQHSPKNTTMLNIFICFNRNRKQESKMDLSKKRNSSTTNS